MSVEALLAILTSAGLICLVWGVERAVRRDRTLLDKRLRRYGGRAYQLTDDEQKQAASVQVTQMLAKRVEASISGRTFAAALRTDLARANLKLTLGEFLMLQVAAAAGVPRMAPPRLDTVAGARLQRVAAPNAVRPTGIARAAKTYFHEDYATVGWFIPKLDAEAA